ncbi:MAG: hypothetical protein ABJG78_08560 [Cyclobacteriaceae bacterium]
MTIATLNSDSQQYPKGFDDKLFTKKMLNRILTHYRGKQEFDMEGVMFEIYNDIYPSLA